MVAVMAVALALWVLAGLPPRLPRQGRRRERVRTVRKRAETDVGAYVAEVATRLRSGVSTREAWDRTALRWGLPAGVGDDGVPYALADLPPGAAVAGARAAARLAAELGSPLADMLDACADGLTRAEENEAARPDRAPARARKRSARLLAALPVVGLALGTVIGLTRSVSCSAAGWAALPGWWVPCSLGAGARWSRGLVAAARAGLMRRGVGWAFARVRRTGPEVALDDVLVGVDLVAAALRTGAPIPRALQAVGAVCGSERLQRTGALLLLGAAWEEAWGDPDEWREGPPLPTAILGRTLGPAWRDGANPVPLLQRAAASLQSHGGTVPPGRPRGGSASRLVLPLGLCHLPAFIAIGVVPVLLSTGAALLGG